MTDLNYTPTEEQRKVIEHAGSAFVTACPGAGKTRTMVERARIILHDETDPRGIAFLSFTNAAVEELEARLRAFGVLPVPLFPSFIGTFDRFLWQFLIAPFGIQGCTVAPRLIPDKGDWQVIPFDGAQPLSLKCFDRVTGKVDILLAKEEGYDVTKRNIATHEARALAMINSSRTKGHVDFEDIRLNVRARLEDTAFAERIGAALAGRFREIFVDEAQDCNPADLKIVEWLRQSGITVKVICDPYQSIYEFRGGVTNQLMQFAQKFPETDRLPMSGNFRSTPAICGAIVALRPPAARANPDLPLGRHNIDEIPVHILAYSGKGVSTAIGQEFKKIAFTDLGIPLQDAPILAATRATAAKAIGQPASKPTQHKTLLLAEAVTNYHFSFALGNRREALARLHCITLLIQGDIANLGEYHTYFSIQGLEDGRWRPGIIEIANGLRFDPSMTTAQWLQNARSLFAPRLADGFNINQRLRFDSSLSDVLVGAPTDFPPAKTIHSVKGLEFPAVCVVMTSQTAGKILDLLEGKNSPNIEEDARKVYVGASRAQRLLVFAIPKSQANRLDTLLTNSGCTTILHDI